MSIAPFKIQIRFADLDLLGHVNNSVYFSYLEVARVHYMDELLGPDYDFKRQGFLLVRNEMDYRRPIFLRDAAEIRLWVSDIGSKSFAFQYEISVAGVIHAEAKSVMVSYDSIAGRSTEIPQKLKATLLALKE